MSFLTSFSSRSLSLSHNSFAQPRTSSQRHGRSKLPFGVKYTVCAGPSFVYTLICRVQLKISRNVLGKMMLFLGFLADWWRPPKPHFLPRESEAIKVTWFHCSPACSQKSPIFIWVSLAPRVSFHMWGEQRVVKLGGGSQSWRDRQNRGEWLSWNSQKRERASCFCLLSARSASIFCES